jgi:hypothetical protein
MNTGISEAILSAIESQKNNRAKSKRRKERAEKRKKEIEETDGQPPTKKAKKTNSGLIKLTDEHKQFLGKYFHCTPFYNAPTDSVGVFTGFDLVPCMHYAYPVLLGPVTDKNGDPVARKRGKKDDTFVKATNYVLGCGNPVNIFTGLRHAFSILFPKQDPTLFRKWEAYRWNNEYYTSKVSGQASDFNTYLAELGETKVFGGAKPLKGVHVIEDIGVSRQLRAINLADHFARVPFHLGVQAPIPETAMVNSVEVLHKIRELSHSIKEDEAKAEKEAISKLKKKGKAGELNWSEPESESDYSSE